MRIGELAARAGVNVQTILFYERRRLLPRPPRTPGGYRAYTDADLARVEFIRHTQQLGFTLKEIGALLPIHGSPGHADGRRRRSADDDRALFRIVTERLAHVDAQIAALERMRQALRLAIDQGQSRIAVCPATGYTAAASPRAPAASTRRHKKKA